MDKTKTVFELHAAYWFKKKEKYIIMNIFVMIFKNSNFQILLTVIVQQGLTKAELFEVHYRN